MGVLRGWHHGLAPIAVFFVVTVITGTLYIILKQMSVSSNLYHENTAMSMKLVARRLKARPLMEAPFHSAELERTTLGKPSALETPAIRSPRGTKYTPNLPSSPRAFKDSTGIPSSHPIDYEWQEHYRNNLQPRTVQLGAGSAWTPFLHRTDAADRSVSARGSIFDIGSQTATGAGPDTAMYSKYDELAQEVFEKYEKLSKNEDLQNNQLFVGIGGDPGAGKSTLAEAVAKRLNDKMGEGSAIVVPMDGYHMPSIIVRAMGDLNMIIGDPERTAGNFTTEDELRKYKGAPWTFNAPGVLTNFAMAREWGNFSFPTYNRTAGEPSKEVRIDLTNDHKIAIFEGNYLLCFDDLAWHDLNETFDEKWYVTCPTELLRERLALRHLETWNDEKTAWWGAGKEGALAKADGNDILNAKWAFNQSHHGKLHKRDNSPHYDKLIESKNPL